MDRDELPAGRAGRRPSTVLPFDTVAARRFGMLKAALERLGPPLAEPDLRIASIALTHELTLLTHNVRHFEQVPGLAVENWIDEGSQPVEAHRLR